MIATSKPFGFSSNTSNKFFSTYSNTKYNLPFLKFTIFINHLYYYYIIKKKKLLINNIIIINNLFNEKLIYFY